LIPTKITSRACHCKYDVFSLSIGNILFLRYALQPRHQEKSRALETNDVGYPSRDLGGTFRPIRRPEGQYEFLRVLIVSSAVGMIRNRAAAGARMQLPFETIQVAFKLFDALSEREHVVADRVVHAF
jgi:hypothetical protein